MAGFHVAAYGCYVMSDMIFHFYGWVSQSVAGQTQSDGTGKGVVSKTASTMNHENYLCKPF